MVGTLPSKSPEEVLDYRIDASGLLQDGETLAEAQSSITVTGATKDSEAYSDNAVTVWLSGGSPGTLIKITALLKTSGGRTFQRVYVIPYGEPVSLEQAKQQIRVLDSDEEDELIAGYIRAAREWVENYTGLALVRREFTEFHRPERGVVSLYRRPIVSASVAGFADTRIVAGRLFPGAGLSWPYLAHPEQFEVTYTAGYAEGEVPQSLIQAMLLLIGHYFVNRSSVGNAAMAEIPLAVTSLCDAHRSPSL